MASKTFNRNQTKLRKARQAAQQKLQPKQNPSLILPRRHNSLFDDPLLPNELIERLLRRFL